ncbi:MAG: hypothetical protein SFW62_00710 [Alphaproteobacteria bacterium]|nr:hypothetical protein [Alphaproteobacteria bacterium]
MNKAMISLDGSAIVISVPVNFTRKFGRRYMIVPPIEGDAPFTAPPRRDDTLLKALARAHKWSQWLETGKVKKIDHLAADNDINPSYVSRIIRLNLLAPDIKEMILDGRQPKTLKLSEMLKPFPDDWQAQRRYFGLTA